MCADDPEGILDQLELVLLFYPSLLAKNILLCVEAELIQAKEGISLPEIHRGIKKAGEGDINLTMLSFKTKYIPFPLS